MKIKLLPTLLLVLSQTFVFSQSIGDYRSTQSGLWTAVSSWQYYDGSSWITPSVTSPQGYPGQYAVTAGAVLIQGGHTISINKPASGTTAISTEHLGTVTITGTLILNGDLSVEISFIFKTLNIIVTPNTGLLSMVFKATLWLTEANAVLQVSGSGLNNNICSNNQKILIGTTTISSTSTTADCSGSLKFVDVTSASGTPNAIPTTTTPVVCQGNAVNLAGGYSGLGSTGTVTYSWSIIDPNNSTVVQTGKNQIIATPLTGTYKATLKCTAGIYINSETINIVVNPTPEVPTIGVVKPIDCNSSGSVEFSGLPTLGNGTWTINPGNISGSGANKTITGLAVGSYSFTVTNQYGCTSPAAASITITDKTSSTWTKVGTAAGSWSNGTPIITTNVILDGNYDTSSEANITACSLTVNKDFILTVADGKFVTIQNHLTVAAGATLNINNQGSLVMISDAGTVTNNGTMKVNKTTTPFEKSDYTYWSSPITSTPISYNAGTTFANWRSDHAYYFNPANFLDLNDDGFDDNQNDWVRATTMDVRGRGYIIMGPTWLSSYPAIESVVFNANVSSNKLNTGIINVPIALTPGTGTDDDWNLIGNPYPCAIDAIKFINVNSANIDATLYFWTHKANLGGELNLGPDTLNFSQSDYAMFNLSGGTATSATISTSGNNINESVNSIPLGNIASCQGFFVEAQKDNVDLIFNNDMRVGSATTAANTQFYKKTPVKDTTIAKDRLWLNLENKDGMFSQQLVGYFENSTKDFDNGYDGLLNDGGNYINFYSFINESAYKIQGRNAFNDNDQVRLGYFSAVAGTFNINIDSKEGVFSTNATAVFLEDKLLGVLHNLKKGSYRFSTESGTFDDRFVLRYSDKTLGTEDLDTIKVAVFVSVNDKNIRINSSAGLIDKVQVFDLLGRFLYQKTDINSNELNITNVVQSHQVLVVKTILQNGQAVSNKIVY